MSEMKRRALEAEGTRQAWILGKVLANRYRLEDLIGRGAMGLVWRARDQVLESDVAIKQLPPEVAHDPQGLTQLKLEAKTAMSLTHPGIVRVHNLEEGPEGIFLVMEYVEGESLAVLLARRKVLSPTEVRRLGERLCEALGYAHQQRVIHRDIKPGNILITREGLPKLADFGIARSIRETMHRVSRLDTMGTLPYMAPEQIRGRTATVQTDLYQLGVTLYECLAGRTPFFQGALEWQILNEEPPALNDVPPPLASAVLRTLAKDPDQRPRDANAFVELLRGEIEGESSLSTGIAQDQQDEAHPEAKRPRETDSKGPPANSHRRAIVLGGAGFLVVLAIVVAFLTLPVWRQPGPASAPSKIESPPLNPPPVTQAPITPGSPAAPKADPASSQVPTASTSPPSVARSVPVTVEVRSDPQGADLYLDWKPKGRTPVALGASDSDGFLVVAKEGYQAGFRKIGPSEAGPVQFRLMPDAKRSRTRLILVVAEGLSGNSRSFLRSRLIEEGFTIVGEEETREFQRELGRAGGLSNRALRAWGRARFDSDILVLARVRQSSREISDQDLGYQGLRQAVKGMVRSEVTVDLEVVDLQSGNQLAAFSGKGSAFGLGGEQSLEKALTQAVSDSAKSLRQRLQS